MLTKTKKEIYYKNILSNIYYNNLTTRTKLAKKTGLNMATISLITNELIKEGLVFEAEKLYGKLGRSQVNLRFNKEGLYSISLSFNTRKINGALLSLEPKIIAKEQIDIEQPATFEKVLAGLKKLTRNFIDNYEIDKKLIWGISIGDYGIIDKHQGTSIRACDINGWENVPLKKIFENEFQLPTFVAKAEQIYLLGEKYFGTAREYDNASLVLLSSEGIGSAHLINNQLLSTKQGTIGEIGHTKLSDSDKVCRCGGKGCLETEIAPSVLVRAFQEELAGDNSSVLAGKESIDFNDLIMAAQEGDALTLKLFHRWTDLLGLGIANLVTLFNPDILIFSGMFPDIKTRVMRLLINKIRIYAFLEATEQLKIVSAHFKEMESLEGGVALVINERLRN